MKHKQSKTPKLMDVIGELRRFNGNDRSLILITNGYCELLVEILIEERCKNRKKIKADRRSYPYSAKLLLLNELGIIDDPLYCALDRFRDLRNRAAHDAIFAVDESDMANFLRLNSTDKLSLAIHCIVLLSRLWTSHQDLFNARLYGITNKA